MFNELELGKGVVSIILASFIIFESVISKSAYVIDELSSFTYTKLGPITFSELLEDPQIVPDVVGLSQFNATLNKINAQNGKKISSDLAEELRGEIHTIQNKLGASLV
jgi:hypothetical protein